MSERPLVVTATTAAVIMAVVAVVVLVAAVLIGHGGLARAGLICLFAVPVVRNAVVIVRGRGSERTLAAVGVVVVIAVAVAAFAVDFRAAPVDRATPALPTSTP